MVDHEAIIHRLRADLARRCLPEHIEDPAVLATIGALLRRPSSQVPREVVADAAAA